MTKGRCLGVVGGLGVGATLHYYQKLAEAHNRRGRSMDIVIAHAETAQIFEYVRKADRNGMTEYLNGFLRRLRAAGAEVGVVPAVTPLYCWHELAASSVLPLVSLTGAVAEELATRSARRVAVFGTRYVVESGFYGLLDSVEVVRPRQDEVELIDGIYAELLREHRGTQVHHHKLTELAGTLIDRERLDAILIAGTDLSRVFNESNTTFPHVDCAAAHLKKIEEAMLS